MGHHYHTPSTQKSEAIEEEGMEGWLQPQVEEDWSKTMSTGYDRIHHAYLRLHRQLMSAGGGSQFGFFVGRVGGVTERPPVDQPYTNGWLTLWNIWAVITGLGPFFLKRT